MKIKLSMNRNILVALILLLGGGVMDTKAMDPEVIGEQNPFVSIQGMDEDMDVDIITQ